MANRIYVVSHKDNILDTRLVRAGSQAQAVRHVASVYEASPASADDIATYMGSGVRVETAGVESAAA